MTLVCVATCFRENLHLALDVQMFHLFLVSQYFCKEGRTLLNVSSHKWVWFMSKAVCLSVRYVYIFICVNPVMYSVKFAQLLSLQLYAGFSLPFLVVYFPNVICFMCEMLLHLF